MLRLIKIKLQEPEDIFCMKRTKTYRKQLSDTTGKIIKNRRHEIQIGDHLFVFICYRFSIADRILKTIIYCGIFYVLFIKFGILPFILGY